MELQNIHIQVSIDSDEVACKEEDFDVLSKVTTYCLAWKNEILEEEDLETLQSFVDFRTKINK